MISVISFIQINIYENKLDVSTFCLYLPFALEEPPSMPWVNLCIQLSYFPVVLATKCLTSAYYLHFWKRQMMMDGGTCH